jgi:hypothetical protein
MGLLGTFHELCLFYYLSVKNFDEYLKQQVRVNYFYKELEKKIGQQSPEYDHVQAIYILYLLTFNKYLSVTKNTRVSPPASVYPIRQAL